LTASAPARASSPSSSRRRRNSGRSRRGMVSTMWRCGTWAKTTLQELAQHPLDDWSQGSVLPYEAGRPDAKQLFQVLFDEPMKRRLARSPRPVDPASDLHAQPRAGGRGTGRRERRPSCLPGLSVSEVMVRRGPGLRALAQDGRALPPGRHGISCGNCSTCVSTSAPTPDRDPRHAGVPTRPRPEPRGLVSTSPAHSTLPPLETRPLPEHSAQYLPGRRLRDLVGELEVAYLLVGGDALRDVPHELLGGRLALRIRRRFDL
jgi:hypothetical protein